MLPYRSDFTDYVKYVESRHDNSVILGNGTTKLRILGKGSIKYWVEVAPHTYHHLVLSNILHIEGIKR